MNNSTDKLLPCREAFEIACEREDVNFSIQRDIEHGGYLFSKTRSAWVLWQQAWNTRANATTPLPDAEALAVDYATRIGWRHASAPDARLCHEPDIAKALLAFLKEATERRNAQAIASAIESQITNERMCIKGRWWVPVDSYEQANSAEQAAKVPVADQGGDQSSGCPYDYEGLSSCATDKIKPCPCCGSRDSYLLLESSFRETRWMIYCTFCGCNFNERVSRQEAIERWNRRAIRPESNEAAGVDIKNS